MGDFNKSAINSLSPMLVSTGLAFGLGFGLGANFFFFFAVGYTH